MTENNQETPDTPSEPSSTPEAATESTLETPTSFKGLTNDGRTLFFWGLGRRKSAVARVRLKPGGSGKVMVNKKGLEAYFVRAQDRRDVLAPLKLTKILEHFDVFVNVKGGGLTGQAGAIRLGVARAISKYDEKLTDMLRAQGYMTRDSRNRERKKYGRKGARASYQFSKR